MKTVSVETLAGLNDREGGLTLPEVESQRARHGPNDIVEVSGNPRLELLLETLKDPMIWLLVGIGSVFLATKNTADGITLFAAIFPLIFMDLFLHWRTQSSTASLKNQLNTHVKAIRSSKDTLINSHELVPGDLILVAPGTILPADGIFESTRDLQVDESALTGESLPIKKDRITKSPFSLSTQGEVKVPTETLGYAGTRVLIGSGSLRIILTGARTSYGEIVQSVSRMPHERTPLQESIKNLVHLLIAAAAGLCLLLAAVRVHQGHGWLDALLSAAILAVAAIPEEFPVVFTFFLGVGVYRLARRGALVRRAVSVENIGRITQICTDKTGTITEGRLTLTHLHAVGADDQRLLITALTASGSSDDPIDIAIHDKAREQGVHEPDRWRTIPFTEDRKRETGFFRHANGRVTACIKGAPEPILAMADLTPEQRRDWLKRVSEYAKAGHKVIAVAKKDNLTAQSDKEPDSDLEFCGLLAFEDPPRPEVGEAMSYCRKNGIRVLMITGDHPDTAGAIAVDAGMVLNSPTVVSAEDEPQKFEEIWLNQNSEFLKRIDVVARCTPMQKLRIVNALKRSGELVAVTGDGVNDVPALKAADIGIAMGERGTRSAKEVSSIILTDDNFGTIINAIREGRQLFRNLRMSFEYLLLIHIPLVLTAAIIPLMGFPLAYLPIHIVWLELVIHPTALLAFQKAASTNSDGLGDQKAFFSKSQVVSICAAGVALTLAVVWLFHSRLDAASDFGQIRAMTMALLTLWSAGVTLHLTLLRSRVATGISAITILSSVALIQLAGPLEFLHLAPLHPTDWIVAGLIVTLILATLNLPQLLKKKLHAA